MKIGQLKIDRLVSGLPLMEFADTLSSDYDDVSSVHIWSVEGLVNFDYIYVKDRINEIASVDWATLTTEEKYIVLEHNCSNVDDTSKVMFLMSQGYSQQQAQMMLLDYWDAQHDDFVDSCVKRWRACKPAILLRMSKADSESFLNGGLIETAINLLIRDGMRGSNYGDSGNSLIMDFFEATGDYAIGGSKEGEDLANQGFIFNPPFTVQNLIDAVKDILINGNY